MIQAGAAEELLGHLRSYPQLVHQAAPEETPPRPPYFASPLLIHFLPDNPVRSGKVDGGCVDCLDVLVGMGTTQAALEETLALACSSQSLHESRQDVRLIPAIIQAGANPDAGVTAALGHKMPVALNLLLQGGASKSLTVKVALGEPLTQTEGKGASGEELQQAIAAAAIWGQSQDVALLAEAGADLDALCPQGFHPHSAPLHQAVTSGSQATVLALLEAGSDPLVRDNLWGASPLGWAEHMGLTEMGALLKPWQMRASDP